MSTVIANTCIHYDLMYVLHSLELCGRVGISDLDKATDNIPSICFNAACIFLPSRKLLQIAVILNSLFSLNASK